MFKDFAVNKRAFSKIVYQILSIVINMWSKFITYMLMVLWRKEYLSYSFWEERCIFQGGSFTSTILCKSIIDNKTIKVQSWKFKKKSCREMIASAWKINVELVAYLLIKLLELFTSEFEFLGKKWAKKAALVWFCVFFRVSLFPR